MLAGARDVQTVVDMGGERSCNAASAGVFTVGIVAGTVCILTAKVIYEEKARGITGKMEPFKPPIFEALVMFTGMLLALPMYWATELWKRFKALSDPEAQSRLAFDPPITMGMLLSLAVPALLDIGSTALLMAGLMHIPASTWQLLRGGCIVLNALMKQFYLNSPLSKQMWLGVSIITVAVCLVGASPLLDDERGKQEGASTAQGAGDTALGLMLTLGGTCMQALQYAYEEKVMSGDCPAPPWLLVGMEGFYGTLFLVVGVYPIAGMLPGDDHGAYENFDNTLAKLQNNPTIVFYSAIFCGSVFILNSFSVLVTYMLSSVWHAILDNFRPISIWATQLVIFSATSGEHGEEWTRGSWLQLAGLFVMLYGTAVYNGTVSIPGLPPDDLLSKSSLVSTPALARSPLMTKNMAPLGVTGPASPYAERAHVDKMPLDLSERLV